MEINLLPDNGFLKFDAHLPLYNWFHPVSGQETTRMDRDALYSSINIEPIRSRALYVHIPFCETICTFCPLIRGMYKGDEQVEAYVRALLTEFELKCRYPTVTAVPIGAIFFGGGTPSILNPDQILRIGAAIHKHFDLRGLKEFNFEMEPKSVTREKMLALREIGVTHARYGIQTFNPKYRKHFNLTATLDQVHAATEILKEVFPYQSFDMLYGMDGQTIEEFAEDIEHAARLGTTNADFYPINNLVTQIRLHKSFAAEGRKPSSQMERLSFKVYLETALRELGFLPHNGHGFVRATPEEIARRPVVTDSYKYQYYDHIYGYFDRDVIGFGNSAISQTVGLNIRTLEDRADYIRGLLENRSWEEKVVKFRPHYEKALTFRLPYHGPIEKRRVDWDLVPASAKETLQRFVEAKLVTESEQEYRLTRTGWYWYVNLMYLLSPESDRAVLAKLVRERMKDRSRREGDLSTTGLALAS